MKNIVFSKTFVIAEHEAISNNVECEIASLKKLAMTHKLALTHYSY